MVDLSGKIFAWNVSAERLYGWPENEATRLTTGAIMPAEAWQQDLAHSRRGADIGKPLEAFEIERKTPSGKIVRVFTRITNLLDAEGGLYGLALMERPVGGTTRR